MLKVLIFKFLIITPDFFSNPQWWPFPRIKLSKTKIKNHQYTPRVNQIKKNKNKKSPIYTAGDVGQPLQV
jgi:hypothetical protein